MKKLILFAIFFMAVVAVFGQTLEKGNLVGVHISNASLKPGITEDQAKQFMLEKYLPAIEKIYGIKCYFLQGIRGADSGLYAIASVFRDENARNKFFDDNPEAKKANEEANVLLKNINEEGVKFWDITGQTPEIYNDYLIVVSMGEPVKKGSLIGIHNLKLKLNENATEKQFLDYHSDYLESAYEDFDPKMKVSVSKILRGTDQGKLAYFIIFDSENARNQYYNKDDENTPKEVELEKAIQKNTEELSKIGTTESVYTDWIVL